MFTFGEAGILISCVRHGRSGSQPGGPDWKSILRTCCIMLGGDVDEASSVLCLRPSAGFSSALLLILSFFAVGLTGPARADTVTFAQFTQRTVSDQAFVYSSNGTSASLNSISGGIPISLLIANGFASGDRSGRSGVRTFFDDQYYGGSDGSGTSG